MNHRFEIGTREENQVRAGRGMDGTLKSGELYRMN